MYIAIGVLFLVGILFLFKMRVDEFKGEEPFGVYLKALVDEGHLFENVLLENQLMVPYLFVSQAGIFNIYYNPELLGRIYGDDEETTWTQVMEVRKLPVPNPVRAMEKQRPELEKLFAQVGKEVPIYEIICLSKRATPKLNIKIPVVTLNDLVEMITSKDQCLETEDLALINEEIDKLDA